MWTMLLIDNLSNPRHRRSRPSSSRRSCQLFSCRWDDRASTIFSSPAENLVFPLSAASAILLDKKTNIFLWLRDFFSYWSIGGILWCSGMIVWNWKKNAVIKRWSVLTGWVKKAWKLMLFGSERRIIARAGHENNNNNNNNNRRYWMDFWRIHWSLTRTVVKPSFDVLKPDVSTQKNHRTELESSCQAQASKNPRVRE